MLHRESDKRVRGRVLVGQLEGWISLLDTGHGAAGHRWAHRQLAATTEWIRAWAESLPTTWVLGGFQRMEAPTSNS